MTRWPLRRILKYAAVVVIAPGGLIVATGGLFIGGAVWVARRWNERNRVVIHPRSRVYQTRNVKLEVVR